jgi:hypothetical protein
MNLKGIWNEAVVAQSIYFPSGTEDYENPSPEYPVSRSRFEPSTSRILVKTFVTLVAPSVGVDINV